jgi:rhodanese-related sulfurtransferase
MAKQINVTEANDLKAQGHTYVDVRSTEEFALGHPDGAFNVPLLEPDAATGQMMPNPDFVRVMQASFPVDASLVIGCQMGGRSMRAAQMLESFGFKDVANVRGGFGGARDPMTGRVVDSGWADSGLPIEDGQPPDRSYSDLLRKADTGE